MASDSIPAAWWRNPRIAGAALWIFGCASYYYMRFTQMFLHEFGASIRELGSQLADWFALSSGAR